MNRTMYRSILHIVTAACMGCFAVAASGQDLDPTVEVTRDYQARHAEVDKPLMDMAVPDSVLRFEIDVDYTVTDNPYKGSYEFRPYSLDISPESSATDARTLFLRVGAGYQLHPVADFVYTPAFRTSAFSMSVYGTHRSYFGRYRALSLKETAGTNAELGWTRGSGKRYSGYDSYTRAGVNGRADWSSGFFTFDVGYLGYAAKDTLMKRGFDAVRADLRVASRTAAEKYFLYDLSVSYLYGRDKVPDAAGLNEHDFSVYASLGPVFSRQSRALLDVDLEYSGYTGSLSSSSVRFSLTPHYVLDKGRWFLDLGAEISVLAGNDRTGYAASPYLKTMHATRGQYVYPDIEVGFDAIRNYLNVYFKADGGDCINRYSSLLARSRFTGLSWAHSEAGMPLMDNTVERVNARLGLKGNIGSRFLYDINGGYARYHNMLLDAVILSSVSEYALPALAYGSCNMFFAEFNIGWHSQDIAADAKLKYVSTDLYRNMSVGFAPSPFTADVDIVYNWKKRIFAGLHCDAALARDGYCPADIMSCTPQAKTSVRIPGYADLGVSVEYKFNRKASVWVYGGNLLDMTIQRSPLYCESGIYFTAGITLSL